MCVRHAADSRVIPVKHDSMTGPMEMMSISTTPSRSCRRAATTRLREEVERRTVNRRRALTAIGAGLSGGVAGRLSSVQDAASNEGQKTESKNSASEQSEPKKRDVRTLQIGKTATLKGGIHITVEEVEFKDRYVRQGSAVTPAKGKQFAIVSVETKNEGKEKHELPRAITLKLKANGKSYSTTSYTGSEYTRIDTGAGRASRERYATANFASKYRSRYHSRSSPFSGRTRN